MSDVSFFAKGVKLGILQCKEFLDIADENNTQDDTFELWNQAL